VFGLLPILAPREWFILMGHSRSLLDFKVTNAAFDNLVNRLGGGGGMDLTIGEFDGDIVHRPCAAIN
jgi:hypothetical protein